jgi:type I restriction enzyme R subunit
VAFSGSVQDPESGPDDFTESSMNPGVHNLRNAFKGKPTRAADVLVLSTVTARRGV